MSKIIDITPAEFTCTAGPSCPGVFKVLATEACPAGDCPMVAKSGDDYIIIGKVTDSQEHPEIYAKVGLDERAVKISAELLETALCQANSPTSCDSSSLPSVALQSDSESSAQMQAVFCVLRKTDQGDGVDIVGVYDDFKYVNLIADIASQWSHTMGVFVRRCAYFRGSDIAGEGPNSLENPMNSVTDSSGDVFADLGLDKEKSLIAMIQKRDASLLSAKERIQELTEALSLMIINANCVVGHWNEFGVEMDLANVMDILERQTRKISETFTQKPSFEEQTKRSDEVSPQAGNSPDISKDPNPK